MIGVAIVYALAALFCLIMWLRDRSEIMWRHTALIAALASGAILLVAWLSPTA